jgi:hypothetical protein
MYARLELAILTLLISYEGTCEETFLGWLLALRLSEPNLQHAKQLVDVFDGLLETGMVQFTKGTLRYNGHDEEFFLGAAFTIILVTNGMVQVSTLERDQPR